jgi:hypothetical protein
MQKYVKHDGQERLTKVPADLDTKRYREEHDPDLLRRMMAAIEKGHVPSARRKLAIRRAVQKMMHDVATRDISQAVPVGGSFVGAPGDCLGMTVQARRRKETSP